MSLPATQITLNYFRIAWQSALVASICLGLPAGLLFWLVILQHLQPSPSLQRFITTLENHETLGMIGVWIGALGWGILLGKISGYRAWWQLVAASLLGISIGRPLFWMVYAWLNIDFSGLPIWVVFTIHLSGLLLSVTFCTGLTHGLLLRNWRTALTLASTTALVSVLVAVATVILLDQLGLRVGTGNVAMPKVTAVSLMMAGITGGMVLVVGFSHFAVVKLPASLVKSVSEA